MSSPATTFTQSAERYLSERRALGFALESAGRSLLSFARFADERHPGRPLTVELAVEWARAAKRPGPVTWARRLEIVRPFARYLRRTEPATEIPAVRQLGSGHRRLDPHIYTQGELSALLREARRLSPQEGLRPPAVATLLGLLACTGLRVSEALKLRVEDVGLDHALLYIRETKFRKSRLVPLHQSAVVELHKYAALRDRLSSNLSQDAFFLVDRAVPLTYSKLRTAFLRLRIRLGWQDRPRPPRVHDLRHSFACHCLLRWHREEAPIESLLLDLSTYLGHAKVTDTYWYLTGFPELLEVIGRRFERFAASSNERSL